MMVAKQYRTGTIYAAIIAQFFFLRVMKEKLDPFLRRASKKTAKSTGQTLNWWRLRKLPLIGFAC